MTDSPEVIEIQLGISENYARIGFRPALDEETRALAIRGLDGGMLTEMMMATGQGSFFREVSTQAGTHSEIPMTATPLARLEKIAASIAVAIGREDREIIVDPEPKPLGNGSTLFSS